MARSVICVIGHTHLHGDRDPSNHETLAKPCLNAGPTSATLAQHSDKILSRIVLARLSDVVFYYSDVWSQSVNSIPQHLPMIAQLAWNSG